MSDGIFYTQVDGKVQGKINARGQCYGASVRSSDDLKWLTARTVWATAEIKHTPGGKTTEAITIPQGGGFDGLYSKSGTGGGDTRLLPKSHITAVKISSTGDWGSVKECELSFTCYSIGQLNSRLAFMELGAELVINYGWGGGSTKASSGQFIGKVWNFNYSVNQTGGWDCTVKSMGKGIDAVSGNIKGGTPGEDVVDPSGLTVPSFDVLSTIKGFVTKAKDLAHNTTQVFEPITIGCLEFAASWGASATSPETESAPADAEVKEDDKHYYVSLESIVKLIQLLLLNPAKNNTKLECNSTITLSPGVKNPEYLISANPKQVIFPGFNKYGDKHDFNFDSAVSMNGGDVLKSNNIMISIEWLGTVLADFGKKEDGQKTSQFGIAKFLGAIFDSIDINSGRRIQLSLTNNPDPVVENGKEWWVVDVNYYSRKVNPFTIQAFNNVSVVRNISINSELTDIQATEAYVAPGSTAGSVPSAVFGSKVNEVPKVPIDSKIIDQLKSLKALYDSTEPPATPTNPPTEIGPTDANISSMQSVLGSIFTQDPDGIGKRIVPYPLSLSVTLDGIDGIIFGNTITTNYMPGIFYDTEGSKIVFTVTKVDHDISISDWTTTLSTVCRMPL